LSQNAAFQPKDKLDLNIAGWTGNVETLKSLNRDDAVRILEREPSILAWAVTNRHIEFVKGLMALTGIRTDLFFKIAGPYYGLPPLHLAAANGDTEMIRLLVRSGAKVGTTEQRYPWRQAIHIAAESPESLDTIKTLVGLGANIKSEAQGQTAMHFALERKWDMATLVYLRAAGVPGLHERALWEVLIHLAAPRGDDEVVRWLKRASTKAPGYDRHPDGLPMQVAASDGQLEVIKYLHQVGESLSSDRNNEDRTPLRLAIEEGHIGVVRYLASQRDISVHATMDKTQPKLTPIHYAALRNQAAVIKVLVEEFGVDPNQKSKMIGGSNPHTALHSAAEYNCVEAARQLVKCGANLNVKDSLGRRATDTARRSGHLALAKELKPAHSWDKVVRLVWL
jgi:ankyrin repeat protein